MNQNVKRTSVSDPSFRLRRSVSLKRVVSTGFFFRGVADGVFFNAANGFSLFSSSTAGDGSACAAVAFKATFRFCFMGNFFFTNFEVLAVAVTAAKSAQLDRPAIAFEYLQP